MTTLNAPPSGNAINVFLYEGFNFRVPNPSNPSFTLQPVSNTSGLDPTSVYFTKNGNVDISFSVSDLSNRLSTGTETFKVTVLDASGTPFVSTNSVTINPGRFLDQFGQTLSNRSFTFFRNEPIAPGTIRLVAPSFKLRTPTSVLSLPPGFVFSNVASNIFDIVGTPSIPFGTSNYLIIGVEDGGSKIVTTRLNIVVSNERVRINLSGSTTVAGMRDGVAIEPRVITAIPPTTSGGTTIQYTFPALPDGIVVKDIFGIESPLRTSFTPPSTDPSFTMIIEGTPSLAAAEAFANAGIGPDGSNISIVATRISPIPQVTSNIDLKFQFAPTVLFDAVTLDDVFVGVPVDQSTNFFNAYTYFAANQRLSNIISISSPDLRSDLSLVHVFGNPRADLSGNNPTLPTGTSTFTVRAEDSSGNIRDLSDVPVNVLSDFITFQPPTPVDACFNFILSRPVSLAKDGYYSSNIQFKAVAASGLSVELSAPALTGTGISLDASGIIVGVPTQVTPLSTLSVIANAIGSPATASQDVQFAIVNDQFTFTDVSASNLQFIQNVRITDVGFPVTTLSDRNVIGYSQTGLPTGLSINSAGIVSGTPTSASPTAGNVRINATTGFASGFRDFSYNITPDAVLLVSPVTTVITAPGRLIGPVQIEGASFSGRTVSNYQFTNLPETYGLTIGSNTGLLNGTLENGFPPQAPFPADSNFQIKAFAGDVSGTLDARIQTTNPFVNRSYITLQNVRLLVGENFNINTTSVYFSDNLSNWSLVPAFPELSNPITDFNVQYTNPNSNEINYLQWAGPPGIRRYTSGPDFAFLENSNTVRAFTADGSGTWWAVRNAAVEVFQENEPEQEYKYFTGSIAKSVDNGITWTDISAIPGQSKFEDAILYYPRNIDNTNDSCRFTSHPYRTLGISLRYKDDVLLLGGVHRRIGNTSNVPPEDMGLPFSSALLRSTNDGVTWTNPTQFEEVAGFNLDVSGMWLAYGSSLFETDQVFEDGAAPRPVPPAVTIKYSSNLGVTWSNATGASTVFTYDITHGNGVWVATGRDAPEGQELSNVPPSAYFSSNGTSWQSIGSINDLFTGLDALASASSTVGPVMFNGTSWNMFVVRPLQAGEGMPIITELYTHDTVTSLASGWNAIDLSQSFPYAPPVPVPSESNARLFLGFTPYNLIKQNGDPIVSLTISTSGVGPTFTSPTTTSYLQYQYMQILPIQISATGVGQIYYFVTAADLPPGLSFNPITAQITGAPVQIGTDSVTVYAKDDNGTSQIAISFNTVIPRIIRKQDGAAAYTSLLRQYTEVVAAQSARDNRALPTEMRTLGEFMSPVPPPVVTPSNCPC